MTGLVSFEATGQLRIELNDADPLTVDKLNITGDLSIKDGATVQFVVTGTPTRPEYDFGTYSGNLLGGTFNSATVPAGYNLVQSGGVLKLQQQSVPEPSSPAAVALIALATARRRRKC